MPSNVAKLIDKFNEELGEGTIHSGNRVPKVDRMPFSVPMANYASMGGLHIGRVNELVGAESSLKSYLAYDMIGKFQHFDWANREENAFSGVWLSRTGAVEYKLRRNYKPLKKPVAKRAVLVDAEGTYTKKWGEKFNIDNDTLIRIQPESPPEAIDMAAALLREREMCLGVYDSASILEMDDESDKSMQDATMGSNTRFWSRAIRKIMRSMNANPSANTATFILINSLYSKVGVTFGNPEVIRNGAQLRLAKSLSLRLQGLSELPDGKTGGMLGRTVSIKCLKNKGGAQGRHGEFFYAYQDLGDGTEQHGTNVFEQYVELAAKYELIARSGNMYSFEGHKFKGMPGLLKGMRDNENLFKAIKARVEKDVIRGTGGY